MSKSDLQTLDPATAGPLPAPAAESRPGGIEIHACWLQIGVYGDSTCPELPKHIHCRNCPVYSSAGVRLLDRPFPDGYRQEWTAHFAREKQKQIPPTRTSAIIFRINSEWLALPTQAFQEVAEHRPIHSLPHRRRGTVLGLVNIRGELLICVDLGRLLGLAPSSQPSSSSFSSSTLDPRPFALRTPHSALPTEGRLLVVSWEGQRLVFPVDEIEGIYRFQAQELKEPPATVARSSQGHMQGLLLWQQKTIGVLAAESLFPALNRTLS